LTGNCIKVTDRRFWPPPTRAHRPTRLHRTADNRDPTNPDQTPTDRRHTRSTRPKKRAGGSPQQHSGPCGRTCTATPYSPCRHAAIPTISAKLTRIALSIISQRTSNLSGRRPIALIAAIG